MVSALSVIAALGLASSLASTEYPAPPLIEAPEAPPPVPSVTKVEPAPSAPSEVPLFQIAALATASVTTSGTTGYGALFGARGEIDVWRIGLNVSYGRAANLVEGLSETTEVVALVGYSVMANRWGRVRVLGGLDTRSAASGLAVGPAFGLNARLGWALLQADVSTTLTPGPFRRLEARAALVLKGGLFELHRGYQATFVDTTTTGTLATLFSSPAAGPYVALGVAL